MYRGPSAAMFSRASTPCTRHRESGLDVGLLGFSWVGYNPWVLARVREPIRLIEVNEKAEAGGRRWFGISELRRNTLVLRRALPHGGAMAKEGGVESDKDRGEGPT